MFSLLEVVWIVFIVVGFSFKAHFPIRFAGRKAEQKPYQPFCHIPQVKEHIKHFSHLGGVDSLVEYTGFRQEPPFTGNYHPEQVYRDEILAHKGESACVKYSFAHSVSDCFPTVCYSVTVIRQEPVWAVYSGA